MQIQNLETNFYPVGLYFPAPALTASHGFRPLNVAKLLPSFRLEKDCRAGLEPATSCVTGWPSKGISLMLRRGWPPKSTHLLP